LAGHDGSHAQGYHPEKCDPDRIDTKFQESCSPYLKFL
jgi:hypothetical protein